MRVSIAIRTRNEAKNLARVIDLIQAQDFSGDVEIIVMDSGSSDNTLEIAKAKGARTFTYEKPFSYGGTINEAAKIAEGDVLVSLSAHSFPFDSAWLKELVKPLGDPTIAATTSRHVPQRDDDPFVRRGIKRRFPCRFIYSYPGSAWSLSNVSAAYRRELVLQYPFDEEAKYSEDYLWARRIMKEGHRVVYVPTSVVIHSHSDLRSLRRQTVAFEVVKNSRRLRWGLLLFLLRFIVMLLYDMPIVLRGHKKFTRFRLSFARRWNIALAWWAAKSGADEYRARFWWVLFWPFIRLLGQRQFLSARVR